MMWIIAFKEKRSLLSDGNESSNSNYDATNMSYCTCHGTKSPCRTTICMPPYRTSYKNIAKPMTLLITPHTLLLTSCTRNEAGLLSNGYAK